MNPETPSLAPSDAPTCSVSLDLRLGDCMESMATFPDGHFDLAIVDPPYGIDVASNETFGMGRKSMRYTATRYTRKSWDTIKPTAEYFADLRRVSLNQIVWGYNYFSDLLPPCRGVVFWDKQIGDNNFSGGELAWTSYDRPLKIFRHYHGGNRVSNNYAIAKDNARIHPTQKPVKLYNWILTNYAKPGQRVLDTHMGSGSIAIAAHYFGVHLTACEIDPDYYAAAMERIDRETRQGHFFSSQNVEAIRPATKTTNETNQ